MSNLIEKLAAKILNDAGNVQAATETLVKVIQKDQHLYRVLMGPSLRQACYAEIRKVCRANHRAVWVNPPSPVTEQQRIAALAQATRSMRLDCPVPARRKQ
jgi:hypothetical protein